MFNQTPKQPDLKKEIDKAGNIALFSFIGTLIVSGAAIGMIVSNKPDAAKVAGLAGLATATITGLNIKKLGKLKDEVDVLKFTSPSEIGYTSTENAGGLRLKGYNGLNSQEMQYTNPANPLSNTDLF